MTPRLWARPTPGASLRPATQHHALRLVGVCAQTPDPGLCAGRDMRVGRCQRKKHQDGVRGLTPWADSPKMLHMTNTASAAATRWNHRDSKGRFAPRPISSAQMRAMDMGAWVDEAEVAHSRHNCGSAHGASTFDPQGDGWLCSTCVEVLPTVWTEAPLVPCKTGTATCTCCHQELPVTKFPTASAESLGWTGQFRPLEKCRDCRGTKPKPRRRFRASRAA